MKAHSLTLLLSIILHGFLMIIPTPQSEKSAEIRIPIRLRKQSLESGQSAPGSPSIPASQPQESSAVHPVEPPQKEAARPKRIPPEERVQRLREEVLKIPVQPDENHAKIENPPPSPETAPFQNPSPEEQHSGAARGRSETAEAEDESIATLFPLNDGSEGVEGTTQPPGSAASTAPADVPPGPDKEILWKEYLAHLKEKVEAARIYPAQAMRRDQEGAVILRVVIGTDGRIEEVRIVEPSPFSLLNQAAVETIRSLSSLPPPPPGFGNQIEVTIPLVYRLERSARRERE